MDRHKPLRRGGRIALAVVAAAIAALFAYAGSGYLAARADSRELAVRADALIAAGHGGADLGPGRIDQLLMVEDPGFYDHSGIDFSSRGAGLTTFTQSVGKVVGFERFSSGIMKIRLMGYAVGLEHTLNKQQIIALWLDLVGMGRGPDGWMTGFFTASENIYGAPPSKLSDAEFLSLVAVPIAPRTFDLQRGNPALSERVSRIQRLVKKECRPSGVRDVWLNGCASI